MNTHMNELIKCHKKGGAASGEDGDEGKAEEPEKLVGEVIRI